MSIGLEKVGKEIKPKIGLALGAGGSRGYAHIGVLQVLQENHIFIDEISGSSMGAVVGSIYCTGMSPKMIQGLAHKIDKKILYDVTVPRLGFIKGNNIENMLKLLTQDKNFEDLKIPFYATAVDLKSSKLIIMNKGKVYKAVRSSIAIPGIFKPCYCDDLVLVDGGVLDRVPTDILKKNNCDIVIGVDVGFRGEHRKAENIMDVLWQTIEVMQNEMFKNKEDECDFLICPDVNDINPLRFEQVEQGIEAGRKAANMIIDDIKKTIKSFKNKSA